MNKVAVLVAIEAYLNKGLDPVKYAANDARELSGALELHGFDKSDQVLLISQEATKTSILSRVGREVKRLKAKDTFYFFFAGHGLSMNGENFLTCYDTSVEDLEGTCIRLQELVDLITEQSGSRRIALFLDCCASGIQKKPSVRQVLAGMSREELEEVMKRARYSVCFASCEIDQVSLTAMPLKHGIWTYHLIQALTGKAPKAANENYDITATSLQNYLSKAVREDVRKLFISERYTQNPRMFGTMSSDFLVANIREILNRKRSETLLVPGAVQRLLLQATDHKRIKYLSGFNKKFHHVPDAVYEGADNFVKRVGSSDIENEINQLFATARSIFKFKRAELENALGFGLGYGSLITSRFEYTVEVSQDPTDPTSAQWTRSLTKILSTESEDVEKLDQLFPGAFDTIVIEFEKPPSLIDIIDQVEADDASGWEVDYEPDYSACTLTKGSLSILITGDRMQFQFGPKRAPSNLLRDFSNVAGMLGSGGIGIAGLLG